MVESPTKLCFPTCFNTKYIEDSSNNEKIVLRAALHNKEEVKKWMENYASTTRSDWIIKKGETDMLRYKLRQVYICQFSKHRKKDGSKRNTDCEVEIDIHVKVITKHTKKTDKFLRTTNGQIALPALIEIKGVHNHHLHCSETLRKNRTSNLLKKKLTGLFDDGHSPAQAKKLISDDLLATDNLLDLADNKSNPTTHSLYHIHRQWSQTTFGKDTFNPIEKLREKLRNGYYSQKDVDVFLEEENGLWSALVVTPVMKRLQKEPLAKEMIFIDSTSHLDVSNCSFTTLSSCTKAGAMPIGILLHGQQTTANYIQAFSLFQKHCPDAFGGNSSPKAVMTDDGTSEKSALLHVWPDAKQYLCIFHVLGNDWKWLLQNCNKEDRPMLMKKIYKVAYAEDKAKFDKAAADILRLRKKHQAFVIRFERFLMRKAEWALYARAEDCLRGNDTNNYAEVSMKIMKEYVLERTRALNPVALIEFIVGPLTTYYVKRLLDHAHGRHRNHNLLHEKLLGRTKNINVNDIVQLEEQLYQVPSASFKDVNYQVHSDIGVCSCKAGERGKYCKHMALLVESLKVQLVCAPPLLSVDKHHLAQLALGDKCPNLTFFLSMTEELHQEAQHNGPSVQGDFNMEEQPNAIEEEDENQHETDSNENISELRELMLAKVRVAFDDILKLAKNDEISPSLLNKVMTAFSKPKSPSAATASLVAMYRSLSAITRRGSYISVNPTGRARRRYGVSKGAKRVPMGRPPKAEQRIRPKPKKPRSLSQNVKANVANAKTH